MATPSKTTNKQGKGKAEAEQALKAAEAEQALKAAEAEQALKAAEAELKADSTKLISIFAGETMPTRSEAKNNLNNGLKQIVTGFFSWFNVFAKLFVNLSTALELEKTDKDQAQILRSKLGDVGQNLFNVISLNRSDIDMTVLHDILMNRNAQPIFDASDFIQKVRFAAYLKKVTENKVTKDKDGNIRSFAAFDKSTQWTAPYFTRCLLLACSKKHIKEQKALEAL